MGQQQSPGCSITPARLKLLMCLLAAGLGFYVLGPPLYWHFAEQLEAASSGSSPTYCRACPACECDSVAGSHSAFFDPGGTGNVSLADCGGDFPEVQSELWSSKVQLLEEELALQEKVAVDNQERSDSAFLDAKKLASQYQKEAEKCNIGMETSEEARERAEAALLLSRKLAAQWEQRARDLGWKDGQRHFPAQAVADPHDPNQVGASSFFQDSSSRSQPGRFRRYFGGRSSSSWLGPRHLLSPSDALCIPDCFRHASQLRRLYQRTQAARDYPQKEIICRTRSSASSAELAAEAASNGSLPWLVCSPDLTSEEPALGLQANNFIGTLLEGIQIYHHLS